ncbi:DNA adenine methylase [Gloeocapsopsis crepidinum LEGE 06123]|uniref:site-specific DNA-methyltransferase (adenine-specific) n=1 Tax=Gloeocapsopsis crepidinum LEGE 06123 TaxID=588587 RepID=A0ABR9UVA0_9CHRO|nr:DNA adenine methylase [Gloeocapsopsis crepidinum]MBE9192189.1 DNA adenine methylase [Gloeocapsopsis crepidinum LEGE 06123]
MSNIKSPLRYPGGKSKALSQIIPHIPLNITEYREPFVGGGSIFLAVKQLLGNRVKFYWINDLNYDLCCFWEYAQDDIESLVARVTEIKQKYANGREIFTYFTREDLQLSKFERAVRFFVLNRITFSGTVDSGGYSQQAFERRFTDSSIDRLRQVSPLLSSVYITNKNYEDLLNQDRDGVFLFLDPPYFRATKSRLYGVRGGLHTSFDHERFAINMCKCQHRWLITYDDSPEIRKLFNFAKITEWTLQYGMNNYKQKVAAQGKELIIKNY